MSQPLMANHGTVHGVGNEPTGPAVPSAWAAVADPGAAVEHAVPHPVVSQVLRPNVASFLSTPSIRMLTEKDAQCCVTELELRRPGPGVFDYAVRLPRLVRLTGFRLDGDLSGFSRATGLRELRFSNCSSVDQHLLAELPRLTDLRRLELCHCPRGYSLELVGDLPQLEVLSLASFPGLDTDDCRCVAKFTALRELDLRDCAGIGEHGLAHIATLPHLRVLDLSGCEGVDHRGLQQVAQLPGLRVLRLCECRNIDADGFACVGEMALEELDLNSCTCIDAEGLHYVSRLEQLTILTLRFCRVDEDSLLQVARMVSLRSLDLSCTPEITPAGLALLSRLTKLEVLKVDGSGVDGGLVHLTKLTALRELFVSDCIFTEDGLPHITKFKQLRVLGLDECALFSDGLGWISELDQLCELSIDFCDGVDREGLEHVAKMERLRRLTVPRCPGIDEIEFPRFTKVRVLD